MLKRLLVNAVVFGLAGRALVVYGQTSITVYNNGAQGIQVQFGAAGSFCGDGYGGSFGPSIAAGSSTTISFSSAFNGQWGLIDGARDSTSFASISGYTAVFGISGADCIHMGAVSDYVVINYGGSSGGGPGGPSAITNNGCVTLQNNTTGPQYYQFGSSIVDGSGGHESHYSGCSTAITMGGVAGTDANTVGNYMAVYPGESVTVCCQFVSALDSVNGTFGAIMANTNLSAAGQLAPCGIEIGNPRCVTLCDDGVPADTAANLYGLPGTSTNGTPSRNGQTNLAGGGGAIYAASTNNIQYDAAGAGQVALDSHMTEGFSALYSAMNPLNGTILAAANNANAYAGLELVALGTIASNTARATVSITNSGSNYSVTLSNGPGSGAITNWPTNYPDAQAIVNTGQIGTNTSTNTALAMAGWISNQVSAQALGNFDENSNNAAAGVAAMSNQIVAAFGSMSNYIGIGAPDGGGYSFALGNDTEGNPVTMSVGLGVLGSTATAAITVARDAISVVIIILIWYVMLGDVKAKLAEVYGQPQLRGSRQQIDGTNAAVPTKALYFGIFVAVLVSVPTVCLVYANTFLSGGVSSVSGSSSGLSTISGAPAWPIVTALLPISLLVTAFFNYGFFKFVVVEWMGNAAKSWVAATGD